MVGSGVGNEDGKYDQIWRKQGPFVVQMLRILAGVPKDNPKCSVPLAILTDVLQCYAHADPPQECKLQVEDYLECLHHRKEVYMLSDLLTGDQCGYVDFVHVNAVNVKQAEHQVKGGGLRMHSQKGSNGEIEAVDEAGVTS